MGIAAVGNGEVMHGVVVKTRGGDVRLPAYMPVTTFGGEFPLDNLIRPFLHRFVDMLMVSYGYALHMKERQRLPCFIDSGGFVLLLEGSRIVEQDDGTAGIVREVDEKTEVVDARSVLALQESLADFASTLDFPIPVSMDDNKERERRMELTLRNAKWALDNRRREDLVMFGSVQGWSVESYGECARRLVAMGYKHLAIGGLVPRSGNMALVCGIVREVRRQVGPDAMVHCFGLGEPTLVREVFKEGATSVDSSSFVRAAASGKRWDGLPMPDEPSGLERAHAAVSNVAFAAKQCGAGAWSSIGVPATVDEPEF